MPERLKKLTSGNIVMELLHQSKEKYMKTKLLMFIMFAVLVLGSLSAVDELQVVKDVTAEHLNLDPNNIDKSDHFIFDLGATNFQRLKIIDELAEIFEIDIPDEEAENLTTVGNVSAYLAKD